jgi:hypothetical protein
VEDIIGNLDEGTKAVVDASNSVRSFVSTMNIMTDSLCDTAKYATGFATLAATCGTVANLVLTYQGVQALKQIAAHLKDISENIAAQTSLMASKEFAERVYKVVTLSLALLSIWFIKGEKFC